MKQKGGKHLIESKPSYGRRSKAGRGSNAGRKERAARKEYFEETTVAEETLYYAEEPAVDKAEVQSPEANYYENEPELQPAEQDYYEDEEPEAQYSADDYYEDFEPVRRSSRSSGAKKRSKIALPALPKFSGLPRIPMAVKILLIVIIVIGLLVGGVLLFIDSKLNKLSYGADENTPMKTGKEFTVVGDNSEFNGEGLEVKESGSALPTDDVFADENVINILLLGTDMKIPGTEDPGRCDMTMICSLNKTTGDIKLVSFERTIGVPVPKYEDEMLSYVFQYGGGEFMQETINKCFLVDITGYVHISYEMFPQIIDAMGGIDVELDQSEVYHMSEYLGYDPAKETLHTGMCHLNGTAAYSFCRLRDPDDDWGRQRRLREAVTAMVGKLKTLSVKDMNNMANTILPMINTNLTKAEIKSLMSLAPKFIGAEVGQLMIPEKEGSWTYVTGRGAHMLGCDFAACAKEIKEFLYN